MLKNGKDLKKPMLPLDKYGRRILVAGRHADDIGCQCGGWTVSWQGSSGKTTISRLFSNLLVESSPSRLRHEIGFDPDILKQSK